MLSVMRNNSKKTRMNAGDDYILSDQSPFAIQEAYKALRTSLIFSTTKRDCQVILVTSGDRNEAKSTTAVNLALCFAQNRNRVLLIDCDLRMPTIAGKLKLPGNPGLTDMLVGRAKASEAIRKMATGLYVLPAGTLPPHPAELLGSDMMKQFLEKLKPNFDQIILDTPPVIAMSDALLLSPCTSGVVLVSREGESSIKNLRLAIQKLEFAKAHIFGLVLTGDKSEKFRRGKTGYGYGKGYENAFRE